MKDIKFRFWNWNKMSHNVSLNDIEYEWFPAICLDDSWEEFMPHITIMEYIWLKDINGKEIYAWDIIKGIEIQWNYEILTVPWWFWVKTFVWFMNCTSIYTNSFNKLEVVWNIYENPLLLNK